MTPLAETIQRLTERARATLPGPRLLHLLGSTHVVVTLAQAHGLGAERGAVAGLIHDLSKPLDAKTTRSDLRAWGMEIPPEDEDFPRVWHGMHAAQWARRELGLEDVAILDAVALHTTADAGAGLLCQAMFIADLAEPTRRVANAPRLLELARRDLTAGFREALQMKIAHVLAKGGAVHPRAIRAALAFLSKSEADALLGTSLNEAASAC